MPAGPLCGFNPIHQDADYHVVPLAPDEDGDKLTIADQLLVADSNNLVARRVLRVDYPTTDKDKAYSFLSPCHTPSQDGSAERQRSGPPSSDLAELSVS